MAAGAKKGDLERRVAAVRRFNRFYTQRIGVLRDGLLGSPFTLTQARVLYEIAHRRLPSASELGKDLGLDPGYLSRILRDFEGRGFLRRTRSETDGRRNHLALTKRGLAVLAPLDESSRREVAGMLAPIPGAGRDRLADAMAVIEEVLGDRPARDGAVVLRPPQPGDLGWVVHRHGVLYARERGWNERFEAKVAGIVADFVHGYDPGSDRCWIAEVDSEIAGSVLLVRKSATVAKLRLLLVEMKVRGRGIGMRLVEECVRFARQAGFRKIVLETDGSLHTARRLYGRAGFRPVRREKRRDYDHDLVDETWELRL